MLSFSLVVPHLHHLYLLPLPQEDLHTEFRVLSGDRNKLLLYYLEKNINRTFKTIMYNSRHEKNCKRPAGAKQTGYLKSLKTAEYLKNNVLQKKMVKTKVIEYSTGFQRGKSKIGSNLFFGTYGTQLVFSNENPYFSLKIRIQHNFLCLDRVLRIFSRSLGFGFTTEDAFFMDVERCGGGESADCLRTAFAGCLTTAPSYVKVIHVKILL